MNSTENAVKNITISKLKLKSTANTLIYIS